MRLLLLFTSDKRLQLVSLTSYNVIVCLSRTMILIASYNLHVFMELDASSEVKLVPRVPEIRLVSGGNFLLGSPKVARLTVATP